MTENCPSCGHPLDHPREELPRDEQGRYTLKLDDEIRDRLLDTLRKGAPYRLASAHAGISRQTLHTYLRRGRAAQTIPIWRRTDEEKMLAEFMDAVDKAEADWAVRQQQQLNTLGEQGDSRAITFSLERRFPDEYGRTQRIEHSGRDGQPLRVQVQAIPMFDPDLLTDAELEQVVALLRKARPADLPQGQRSLPA